MGSEFVAERGILKGLVLALEEGQEWIIGRDPDGATLIVEDPHVSRMHLVCRKREEGFEVENLSHSNPALLNDEEIKGPTLIHHGDELTIGGTVFVFYPEGKAQENVEEEPLEKSPPEPDEEKDLAIFEEEEEIPAVHLDLTGTTRYLLKVISGPNAGAEIALDRERSYVIGTDSTSCDIVFNDLSVSRQHARLKVSDQEDVTIEDLGSRNGVIVDREKISYEKLLAPNSSVSLGTSIFLLIDREAPAETITTTFFEPPQEEKIIEEKEEKIEEASTTAPSAPLKVSTQQLNLSTGPLALAVFIAILGLFVGLGMYSLLREKPVEIAQKDNTEEIKKALDKFPGVAFSYNSCLGKLFLLGHVQSAIEHNELLYKLQCFSFIKSIDDNIVNDEAVWQEMNILIAQHPEFKGVNMHACEPGVFVLSGYLATNQQGTALTDYINTHFNFISCLQNNVVVEQRIAEESSARLIQGGFEAVNASFSNGELLLTGYISSNQVEAYEKLKEELNQMRGVRSLKNFVVAVTPEQGVIDVARRFPGRYRVTGGSKYCDVNINVVINGKILSRGDSIDGWVVTSIQPNTVFLEKDGVKYKIEYSK